VEAYREIIDERGARICERRERGVARGRALENFEAIMIAQLTIEQSTQRGRERYEIVHKYRKYRREG
jgi:hypothetical protein